MGWGAYLAPEAARAAFNRVTSVKCRVLTSNKLGHAAEAKRWFPAAAAAPRGRSTIRTESPEHRHHEVARPNWKYSPALKDGPGGNPIAESGQWIPRITGTQGAGRGHAGGSSQPAPKRSYQRGSRGWRADSR
jgi:hypothetical protein